jgi:hypothetical protein
LENQQKGFNEVLNHFQKMLLGKFFLHTLHFLLLACFFIMMLDVFCHAASLDQEEVDSASVLCVATDAVKKELDSLLDAGCGACTSL